MLCIRPRFCFTVLLFSCSTLVAADATWESLATEYGDAMESWKSEMTKAQGDGDGNSGMIMIGDMGSMPAHPSAKFLPRVRAYAEQHAGKPAAIPALSWLVRELFAFPGSPSDGGASKWALKRLTEDHAADPDVLSEMHVLPMVAMSVGEESLIAFLDTVAKKNLDKETKGRARLGMAEVLFEDSPMMMMGMGSKPDRSVQKKRVETILRALVTEYADGEIAEEAGQLLFVIEHLQVGMPAPETQGKDVDGKAIRLSDFRGQVVIMVYWATWCVPCMQAIPHERELMEKYKGKPFTLLGINVDDARSTVRKAIKKHEITWPTIHDGMGDAGSICSKWRVKSFPTFVLIDHKGTIRQMGPMLFQMESMIDSLLVEALSDSPGK